MRDKLKLTESLCHFLQGQIDVHEQAENSLVKQIAANKAEGERLAVSLETTRFFINRFRTALEEPNFVQADDFIGYQADLDGHG